MIQFKYTNEEYGTGAVSLEVTTAQTRTGTIQRNRKRPP